MRIETHYNRSIVCEHIFPAEEIKPEQEWQSSSGHIVCVDAVDSAGWVIYSWMENGERRSNTKEAFAFQCRYCLIVNP